MNSLTPQLPGEEKRAVSSQKLLSDSSGGWGVGYGQNRPIEKGERRMVEKREARTERREREEEAESE